MLDETNITQGEEVSPVSVIKRTGLQVVPDTAFTGQKENYREKKLTRRKNN